MRRPFPSTLAAASCRTETLSRTPCVRSSPRQLAHNECVTRRGQNTLVLMIQFWVIESFYYVQSFAELHEELARLGLPVKVIICCYSQVLISSSLLACVRTSSWLIVPRTIRFSEVYIFTFFLPLDRHVQLNRKREKVKQLRVSVVSCRRRVWAGKCAVSIGLIPTRSDLTFATMVVVLLILTVTGACVLISTCNTSKFYNLQIFSLHALQRLTLK